MNDHRADPEQSPILLLVAFVLLAGVLFGLFKLVGSPDHDATTTATEATTDAAPDRGDRDGSVDVEIVEGETMEAIPEPVCEDVQTTEDFTALSYNIKSGRVGGGIGAFVPILRNSGADVILLQEVDQRRYTSGRVDQPAFLGGQLGMEHAFGANVDFGGGLYGTAVLSRYPILSSGNTHLPNGPGGQQRGLLKVVIDVEGVEVSVYNTHLQNKIDYLKVAQMRRIASIIGADDDPKILGGDFNTHPGSAPHDIAETVLDDSWAAGSGPGLTHPSRTPRGRIDYLMHGGDGITALSADVLAVTSSDHRPVRATYRIDGVGAQICGAYVE